MGTNADSLAKQTLQIRKLSSHQNRSVITYAGSGVNSDPYYKENRIIGDLPAGEYLMSTEYEEIKYSTIVEILPVMVTFLRFVGTRVINCTHLRPQPQVFLPLINPPSLPLDK